MQLKIKKIICALVFLALTVTLGACSDVTKRADNTDTWSKIEKRGKVVIGLDDSFVPMGFRQKDGRLVGFDVELARAVFKRLNLKVSFQTIDWSMKETELRNGTIDMIWNGYTKTKAREKNATFSHTYLNDEQYLVVKKNSHITNPQKMKGKILGVQTGSSGYQAYMDYSNLLKKYVGSTVQYDSYNNAFLDLNAKRIQGLLIDSVYANYYIAHQKDASSYRKIKVGYPKEEFAVGMRKGDETLEKKVNRELQRMAQDGSLKKLAQKWFGSSKEVAYQDLLK